MRIRSSYLPVLLLIAVFFYTLLYQGSRGLWDPDEGRYTDISLQMIHSGDFMIPAFNDDLKHFAKPPLTYWAVAGGFMLLGFNEWGARLANTLAISLTATLLLLISRLILPDRARLPVIIYLSFLFPYLAANIVTTDTLLTLWEVLAVFGFLRYWYAKKQDRRTARAAIMLMWLGFALAFLTKGPPGLLPLLVMVLYTLLVDSRRAVAALFYPPGLLIFLVLGLGWYIALAINNPELAHYFFYDEFINRIGSGAHHRNPQWYGALVIYLPTLIIGTLPWTGFLFAAVKNNLAKIISRPWWKKKRADQSIELFLLIWVLLPLVIFFLARSRLPLYILPLFPAIALLLSLHLKQMDFRPGKYTRIAIVAWFCLLPFMKWGLSVMPYERNSRPIARHIVERVGRVPEEILFVDTRPVWGLSLYLDSEIEQVNLPGYQGKGKFENLDIELASETESTLIVARANNKQQLLEWFSDAGYPDIRYWNYRDWLLIIPNASLDWQK